MSLTPVERAESLLSEAVMILYTGFPDPMTFPSTTSARSAPPKCA
jgi:hypothetical protein